MYSKSPLQTLCDAPLYSQLYCGCCLKSSPTNSKDGIFHLIVFILFYHVDPTETVVCNHRRSTEYYIASVQNLCSWKAYPCSEAFFLLRICGSCKGECPSLGYAADRTKKTGRHYLKTNNQPPFCGIYLITMYLLVLGLKCPCQVKQS